MCLGCLFACTLTGCGTAKQRPDCNNGYPSPEALQLARGGDLEAQCKVGWGYHMMTNYPEAARWILKAAESGNDNATGLAGRMLIKGQGVARNAKKGIAYLHRGAECPNIGGNEACALDLVQIYEQGVLVPRSDELAYYYLGVAIAKCVDTEDLAQRPALVSRQRVVGAHLTDKQRQTVDDRLRQWLDVVKTGPCRSMGELDAPVTPNVSVYVDDENKFDFTATSSQGGLASGFEIPLDQMGQQLARLDLSGAARIRVYSCQELAEPLRTQIVQSLVAGQVRYTNCMFVTPRP